jgi:hypothetical protein
MMKKLLAVILVLGMASLAHADLVLTINGEIAPDEIWLTGPSDMFEIDVEIAEGHDLLGVTAAVRLSNGQGELLGGEIYPDIGWMFPIYTMAGSGSSQLEFTGGNFGAATPGPTTIMYGLMFHCLEETDVVIDLIITGSTTQDGQTVPVDTIEDSIIVHQIPEPMTVALLGLGGMFLLRRRK